jgi:hypothetical protein
MLTGCEWLDCSSFVGPDTLRECRPPYIMSDAAAEAAAAKAAAIKEEAAREADGDDGDGPQAMDVDEKPSAAGDAAAGDAAAAGEPVADFGLLLEAACRGVPAAPAPADAQDAAAAAAAAKAADSAAVHCPVAGRWSHLRCFPPDFAAALREQPGSRPCFSSQAAADCSRKLAAVCAAGLISLGVIPQAARPTPSTSSSRGGSADLPLSLLVVRGAAAAAPRDCRGHAPAYSEEQRGQLRVALSAALHLLHRCVCLWWWGGGGGAAAL